MLLAMTVPLGRSAAAPAAAAPAAAVPAAAGLGQDFMLGKWSAMGDCDQTIEFLKGGKVMTPMGEGQWSLTGDQLVINGGPGSESVPNTVVKVDDKTIRLTRAGHQPEIQKRC